MRIRSHKPRVWVPRVALPIAGLVGMVASGAYGQDAGGTARRGVTVQTGLSISETVTDNVNLSATDKRSEAITTVSPYISLNSSVGRLQGSLNYSLSGIFYASGTQSNAVQQSLNAMMHAEAVEGFAFVDATANISRQNISAFGTQSTDSALRTDNQTDVYSYSLSPYVQGRLGGLAAYQVRLNYNLQRGGGGFGDSTSTGGSAHLGSDNGYSFVNWALDASRQRAEFSDGRPSVSDTATASLIFTVTPELHFTLRGGRESSNYNSLDNETNNTYGASVDWRPSERTSLSADEDRRYFGQSHHVKFDYRTPRTVWSFRDSRDINVGIANPGAPVTEYDLLYAQLASQYPDPAQRAQQTTLLLQLLGRNPSAIAAGGFLTNAATLQRTQEFSVGYIGLRTTTTLTLVQSTTSRADDLSTAQDSLSNGATIRQRSVSLSAGYRLTPVSSVSLSATRSQSVDTTGGSGRSEVTTFMAMWSGNVSRRATASMGARHTQADGDAPYTESALFATLNLRF